MSSECVGKAGLCRRQAGLQGPGRVLGTTLVCSSDSIGACFTLLDCRVRGRKGPPRHCAGSQAASPRPLISKPPSGARWRSAGKDWAQSKAGRDLEKPPRLHCSGRGRQEEPVPLSHLPTSLSWCTVPRCSVRPGPEGATLQGCRFRCLALAGRTERVRRRPEVYAGLRLSEKVVRKVRKSCSAPPFRLLVFGLIICIANLEKLRT